MPWRSFRQDIRFIATVAPAVLMACWRRRQGFSEPVPARRWRSSGDLSALYDLNSLALLRQASAPLVLIVVNNNGGQIFSLLPTPQDQRRQFYLMPQDVNFGHAAAMFGLHYHRPGNWEALEAALAGALASSWRQR
ncbi:2-succinyl-5-enolpyruvyl-6-hydroxy-3-cyclohexene-1-carboxylate synthase [Raoultella planticola]|uniref:2-succinyl-5-enolpyruvyl-6-hydroxy-3-cyclohexene-1-carboxylate synthase n=1 Tax=Raoultella planticola TaxID=575 RepID=A0A485C8P1_RAOPL|nr:2-succinyl-5-enolpyruvyl-6-hydroxy-3-cyclohexene-1-carboxylate synthase [Raoultella planticola]